MYEKMRLWVYLGNIFVLLWFITLQVVRFREPGRACSGDYYLGYDFDLPHVKYFAKTE